MRKILKCGFIVLLALVCTSGLAFAGNGKGKMKGQGGGDRDRVRDGSCRSHLIDAGAAVRVAHGAHGPGDGTGNGGSGPEDGSGYGSPDGAGVCG
ncbi:MAG: hypothetical protein MUF52_07735 [Syntrophobacteraceae bacterium]|nr:hypothetical protein [Syntrophobacteraceae bacterium]